MSKKRPPLVTPVIDEIKPNHPFDQVTLDTNKTFDLIHIRNAFIRYAYKLLSNVKCEKCGKEVSYNKRINDISREWFSSPKNIEKIISSSVDK